MTRLLVDVADFVVGLAAVLFLLTCVGCGGTATDCQPSTECNGSTFVRCVDGVAETVDCAVQGRICGPDLSDIHNIVPACMTIGVPPEAP